MMRRMDDNFDNTVAALRILPQGLPRKRRVGRDLRSQADHLLQIRHGRKVLPRQARERRRRRLTSFDRSVQLEVVAAKIFEFEKLRVRQELRRVQALEPCLQRCQRLGRDEGLRWWSCHLHLGRLKRDEHLVAEVLAHVLVQS